MMTADLATTATDPITGELLEHLDQQPAEKLAETLSNIHSRQADLKAWQGALDAELRRRLKLRQTKMAIFGDWEVEASVSRSRAWDADKLEAVMARLVDEGVIRAGDTSDVITRPPVVAGKAALALRSRLTGDALTLIDETWAWKERPGAVTVTRSVDLLDALPEATEPAPVMDQAPGPVEPPPETWAPAADRPAPGPAALALNPEELFA